MESAFTVGGIVVMDNLSIHTRSPVWDLIEAAGAELLFLPSHRPRHGRIGESRVLRAQSLL